MECDICGAKETFPFKCRNCGGIFCSDHRLPESHDCFVKWVPSEKYGKNNKKSTIFKDPHMPAGHQY
jgi:predicted nucleic acid binding AN1-type Zn finger protein